MLTRVRYITSKVSSRYGKVMGLMLGFVTGGSSTWCSMLGLYAQPKTCHSHNVVLTAAMSCARHKMYEQGDALALNRRNLLPCTVRTSSKGRANKGMVVCYVLWLGSVGSMCWVIGQAQVCGLVPCCGQDCYRAAPHRFIQIYIICC